MHSRQISSPPPGPHPPSSQSASLHGITRHNGLQRSITLQYLAILGCMYWGFGNTCLAILGNAWQRCLSLAGVEGWARTGRASGIPQLCPHCSLLSLQPRIPLQPRISWHPKSRILNVESRKVRMAHTSGIPQHCPIFYPCNTELAFIGTKVH